MSQWVGQARVKAACWLGGLAGQVPVAGHALTSLGRAGHLFGDRPVDGLGVMHFGMQRAGVVGPPLRCAYIYYHAARRLMSYICHV